MTVLVDEARWPWRDRRWAHLVSDRSLQELHEAARLLGLRRVGFQGDHYDVDEADRRRAVALGARPVPARELVARLRAAGLRHRGPAPRWERVAAAPAGVDLDGSAVAAVALRSAAGAPVVGALGRLGSLRVDAAVVVLAEGDRLAVVVDVPASVPAAVVAAVGRDLAAAPAVDVVLGHPRTDGERSLEVFAGPGRVAARGPR